MKVVFAHDHYFYHDERNFYSDGKFPYNVWERYLRVFSSVTVVSRYRNIDDAETTGRLNLSSGPNVSFVPVPSLSGIRNMFLNRQLAELLVENAIAEADSVIARVPSEIGALAIKVAKRLGKPWAVEVVGCTWDGLWNHGNWQGKLYAPIATWRTKRLTKQAKHVLYVTRTTLQKRYPTQGFSVACSNVELCDISEDALKRRVQEMALSSGSLTIGLIGTLKTRTKGVDIAIRALASIKGRIPGIKFRHLGNGDPSDYIKLSEQLEISDRVAFDGTLPSGKLVNQWLDSIDIYIQPSYQEGLPRSLIEAMSRGCPAIGSSAGGIPELLSSDYLIKPGDVDALASRILAFANNWELRKEAAICNYQEALNYSKTKLDKERDAFWQNFALKGSRGHEGA